MELTPPAYSGYLLKQSKAEWKTRFVVVENGVLLYFKHKRDCYPNGIVLLNGCSVAPTEDVPGCSFAISHPSRLATRLYFATSDASVTNEWLQSITLHSNHSATCSTRPSKEHAIRPPDLPIEWRDPSMVVPPKHSALISSMISDMAAYVFDHSRWSLQTDHQTSKSTQLYMCQQTSSAAMSKLTLMHPAHEILELLLDTTQKKTYDPQIHEIEPIEVIDGHNAIHQVNYKGMFPRRGREYVVFSHWRKLSDNSILLLSRTIAHANSKSKRREADRSTLHMEGYYIVPNLDNTAAEITYVIHADATDIPENVLVSQAHRLDALRAILDPPLPVSPRCTRRPSTCSTAIKTDSSRVRTFEIPPEEAPAMNDAIETMVRSMTNLSEWDYHSEKDGVRAYSKANGILTTVLGVGSLAFPSNMVLEFLLDSARKISYDPMCADARQIKRLDSHTVVDYYQSKPVLIVSGRDFVNLVHWRVLDDGSIVVVAKATTDTSCPPKDWTVRGEIHVAGWRIVPTKSGCNVSFMVKMDLKGSIPTFVQNKIVVDQAFVILAVRKVLQTMPLVPTALVENRGASVTSTSQQVSTPKVTSAPIEKSRDWHEEHGKPLPVQTSDISVISLFQYFGLFLAALYVPPYINSEISFQVVHELVIWAVIGFIAVQVYLGPAHNNARRQMLIASWKASEAGTIYGSLNIDCTETLEYIERMRAESGVKITLTHVVIRALAHALKKTPSINGHIVLGKFYPSPTVDVSCLVDVDSGNDVHAVTFHECDTKSIVGISQELIDGAQRLQGGKSPNGSDLALLIPSILLRPTLKFFGWLSQSFGVSVSWLGIRPKLFGQAIVANVGRMGLDEGFAPIAPYTNTPMIVVIGAVSKKPVVLNDQVVVRQMMQLNATIDHRYADGAEVGRMAKFLREFIENPRLIDAMN